MSRRSADVSTRPSPTQSSGTSPPAALPSNTSLSTRALHGRRDIDSPARAASPLVGPLVQSTTFHQPGVGATGVYAYSRVSNPSVDETESLLGALEDAPPAVCFGTGLAAETALFLTLLRAGDHAVVGDCIYGGTVRLFRQVLSELGISCTFVDTGDPDAVRGAITPRTRLVFIETPANPTLKLTDIGAIAREVRGANAGREASARILLAVDNTFLTPVLQRPLELGADVSVYATTKLIEGHSTACGGAIVARDQALLDRVRWIRKCTGAIQAPFNAWLTSRGIKTLPLRVREQARNAQIIAERLSRNPHVSRVHFPGLDTFPQRELAARQHLGGLHGSVIAFEVVGGVEGGRRVLESARLCSLVEHVGSVETLLTHPATMTHADVPPEQRRAAGISDGLIRLSVGLEDPADVLADLEQAIASAHERPDPEALAPASTDLSAELVEIGGVA